MSTTLAATQDPCADLSLKKQQVLRRYAEGELTWSQVADGIASIKPPPPKLSTRQKIAVILSTILLSALIPPWARREND
jgi:hypothetical protein